MRWEGKGQHWYSFLWAEDEENSANQRGARRKYEYAWLKNRRLVQKSKGKKKNRMSETMGTDGENHRWGKKDIC